MTAAELVMHAATHNAPPDRREWAHAMQAEFDTLEQGKLTWALGCWSAMLQWRLTNDAGYLVVAVALVAAAYSFALDQLVNGWLISNVSRASLISFATATGITPHPIIIILLCVLVCAYRPNRAFLTSAILIGIPYLRGFWFLLTHPALAALAKGPWRSYDAPEFVAAAAEIGWCFVGCQIGIAIHRLLHRKH